ncbi:MAG: DUF4147 domain-containing protein [Oscillospiraceae bacterium]|nr:DUF4147 domain-containing protein [Oscillospiraceae bacterium]
MSLKADALQITDAAIKASLPFENTKKILKELNLTALLTVIAVGKAAVSMAMAAEEVLGENIKTGLVVTKYAHSSGFHSPLFEIIEASHPVSDENSIFAAERAMEIAKKLTKDDIVLFLVSGGGSALMEKSKVSPALQRDITKKLLARGAEIEEINAVRKRLSLVKGGRLAALCYPARVITIALSDVLSNDKGTIASGLTVKDDIPNDIVKAAVKKYLFDVSGSEIAALYETENLMINDGGYYFAGDKSSLLAGAAKKARELGYTPRIMSSSLTGEARSRAAEIAAAADNSDEKTAYLYAGETTVTLKGKGKGGRNQEMALSAAIALRGKKNIAFISVGSDGTDGPTDAAGGYADGETYEKITAAGLSPEKELENNNSYYALKAAGDLIITGATGTNVNDITVLIKKTDIR